jgi:phosphate starvation-inducible membrane PsiE
MRDNKALYFISMGITQLVFLRIIYHSKRNQIKTGIIVKACYPCLQTISELSRLT